MLDNLTDVTYEIESGLAWITINRPERFTSFRAHTVDELIACFKQAWASPDVGVVGLWADVGGRGCRLRHCWRRLWS